MDTSTVTCPSCHTSFPLTAAIEQPLLERLRGQVHAESATRTSELDARAKALEDRAEQLKREMAQSAETIERKLETERKKLSADLDKKARDGVAVELQDLKEQLTSKAQALAKSQASELELRKAKQ